MLETQWLYLGLNFFTILVPFIRSFEPRVQYAKNWKALLGSIFLVGTFFVVWDVIFTKNGVWGFNEKYLSGIEALGLPLGEWLFFITVPYSCVFIYEVLNYFWPKTSVWDRIAPFLSGGFLVVFAVLAIVFNEQTYTFYNFLFVAVFLAFVLFVLKPKWHGKFYRAYVVGLVGFFMVNGVLTGTGIEEEVVWYNPAEFMGLRMGTIPVEDTFYGMLLIMMNIALFEYFRKTKTAS